MLFTGILRRKAGLRQPVGLDETIWGQENDKQAACLHTKMQNYEEMSKFIKKFKIGKLQMPREN